MNPSASPSSSTPSAGTRIVVVGGVAGGMSAAARARRLDEHASIVVLERGAYVSFANCGLPYHLAGEIGREESLLVQTPQSLAEALALDVRTGSTVTAIDRDARTVHVRTAASEYDLPYDSLLLAPGAVAVRPPIDGLDDPAVHALRTIDDVQRLRGTVDRVLATRPEGEARAVVVGAGFIGLEAVEALVTRGLSVDVVELADHVLPPLDAELATLVSDELVHHGVRLHVGVSATQVSDEPDGSVVVTLSDGTWLPADLVLVNVGVRPESSLARDAGLDLGPTGAIRVDADHRTSDPHVWAVGDAIEVRQAVTGTVGPVPLAGPANRQGRRAADSMLGHRTTPQADVLGTAIVRVFRLTAAMTGASQRVLDRAGIEHEVVRVHPGHHAGYYPGAQQLHIVASFAPDGRLLGAQAVGRAGVDKRMDVLATALRAGMTADDLAELELSYAPPFGSAKDPVNMVGFVAQNTLDGTAPQWHPDELDEVRRDTLVLDVRTHGEFSRGHLPGAMHVPHTQMRDHLDKIRAAAAGRPISVHCQSGMRSYLATRMLIGAGMDARNLSGGWLSLLASRPELRTSAVPTQPKEPATV